MIIETYLGSLEQELLDIDISNDKFNTLSEKERDVLYSLKNDNIIVIKGSGVILWDYIVGLFCYFVDYLKEAHKQF